MKGFIIIPVEWEDLGELTEIVDSFPKDKLHSATGEVHVVIREAADAVQKVLDLTKDIGLDKE